MSGKQVIIKHKKKPFSLNKEWHFYAFIAPWLLGFFGFIVIPMLFSLYAAFTRWNGIQMPTFTGLTNIIFMFTNDDLFWHSIRITFIFAGVSVPLNLFVAFVLAAILNRRLPGSNFFRAAFYLPSVLAGVAIFITWIWMFSPTMGLINTVLYFIGIDGPRWLLDPQTALLSIILMNVTTMGGTMLIILAGLQNIPDEQYEAARIDGANALQRIIYITFPGVSPVIFYCLLMGIIGALQIFVQPWVMTQGGPRNATYVYGIHLYNNAFRFFNFGYASALAWTLFVIIMVLSGLVFKSSKFWVNYGGEIS